MGLDTASAMFLCAAKSLGVDFSSTATIGRQSFFPDVGTLRRVFSVLGINEDADDFLNQNRYSERFFTLLGAHENVSIDYSDYENTSIIHDMNLPIPNALNERFSVVHDGGTIEHVFNITQAFKNCMRMVRIGGHFTQVNVANNYMGHGFWQFSPELLFGIFSPGNGFQIEAVLLHEVKPGGAWFRVTNPDEARSRVELCNNSPTYILTVARRVASVPIFEPPPLQSDYVALWKSVENNGAHAVPTPERRNGQPWAVKASTGWKRYRRPSIRRALSRVRKLSSNVDALRNINPAFNRSYYRQVTEENLLRGKLT